MDFKIGNLGTTKSRISTDDTKENVRTHPEIENKYDKLVFLSLMIKCIRAHVHEDYFLTSIIVKILEWK